MTNAEKCPNCESNDIELRMIGNIVPDGHYTSGEERYKQTLQYYCSFCKNEFEIDANEFIDSDDSDVLEPRECYDPDYASELYREIIEGSAYLKKEIIECDYQNLCVDCKKAVANNSKNIIDDYVLVNFDNFARFYCRKCIQRKTLAELSRIFSQGGK